MVEKDQKQMLDQLLAEAQAVVRPFPQNVRIGFNSRLQQYELDEKLKKHDGAKKEIELLYARIFDGPSQCAYIL